MAFCKNCGAELSENAKFCTSCGSRIDAPEAPKAEAPKTEEAPKSEPTKAQPEAEKTGWDKFTDTPGITDEIDPKDAEDNKAMGILAYLSILCLIPFFAAKESKFAQYHAQQGLFLFIIELIISVVGIIPILGWIVSAVGGIFVFILSIVGIINALNGQAKELPVIGKFNFFKKK